MLELRLDVKSALLATRNIFELDRDMAQREQYPSEKQDRFIVRLPDGMRDRIKLAASDNNRSMNAEIVDTLEEKYPADSIDLRMVVKFLDSLARGPIDSDEFKARDDYLNEINGFFAKTGSPYTIKEDMGALTFYPYASPTNAPKPKRRLLKHQKSTPKSK